MRILLVGSGGREHALAWKIAKSPLVRQLICTPGNPGMEEIADCRPIDDIVAFAKAEDITLVVVGPEQPLAEGLADDLEAAGIPCFGPSAAGAQVETSKAFTKELCAEAGIPVPINAAFTTPADAKAYLRALPAPYVIKADGLAAGKGVVIAQSLAEAEAAVDSMMGGQFGAAGETLVIEEHLTGTEVSYFALTDGESILPCGAAQDHKRAYEGDEGPNTGGMGGFSPSPLMTPELNEEILTRIIRPTVDALNARGITYRGVLYAGLFITDDGPKLIEYNCRFGDPECQILMRRMRSDIVPALWGAATGRLAGVALDWMPEAGANIVMASKGYPGAYTKGSAIGGLDAASALPDVEVFHAGTKRDGDALTAVGGRVLNLTALGDDIGKALTKAYAGVDAIDWPEGFFRSDIGKTHR